MQERHPYHASQRPAIACERRCAMKRPDPRQTPEAKANYLAITVDQIRKGFTDRGIKRLVSEAGLYKVDDDRLQALINEARLKCKIPDPDPDGKGVVLTA